MFCLSLLALASLNDLTVVSALDIKSPRIKKQLLKTGVTSLSSNSDGTTIAAGTKGGRILISSLPSDKVLVWEELPRNEYGSRFPVYSLSFGRDAETEVFFAGSGDRLVSKWRRNKAYTFSYVSTLGPHTGWVKDVKYHQMTNTLFSIGCNCVETWDCSEPSIRHVSKRTIENSPEMGSTLSSDLLSLCIVEDLCLVSGGVDGRLHLWSLDPLEREPSFSCRCHDGRINSIVYSGTMDLLFSAGHDGTLVASRVKANDLQVLSDLEVGAYQRLSTLCIVDEDSDDCCDLVLGTTGGILIIVAVEIKGDKILMSEKGRLQLEGYPMINSILNLQLPGPNGDHYAVLVGHATGMHEVWVHS